MVDPLNQVVPTFSQLHGGRSRGPFPGCRGPSDRGPPSAPDSESIVGDGPDDARRSRSNRVEIPYDAIVTLSHKLRIS
jgi:hypothetical protein